MFKDYLVPHEGNDHRPHLLRPRAVAFVILLALVVEGAFLFSSPSFITRSRLFGIVMVNALIDGTNAARATDGLSALRENPLLDAAAQEKANDMATKSYFAHTSPTGVTPWYWFYNVGYNFSSAGENLAVNFSDSADVTTAWLNSPEHRENIMNAGYREIGMATAQGTFDGQPAIYVVELFGAPAAVPTTVATVPVAPAKPATTPATAPIVKTQTPATPAPIAVTVVPTSDSSFVAVKGAETQVKPSQAVPAGTGSATTSQGMPTASALVPQAIMPAQTPAPAPSTNLVQRAFVDPRHTIDYFYLAIILFFAAALLVNIFVKINIQHPQVIMGGMLVVLIAGLFIVLNQHFGAGSVIVL